MVNENGIFNINENCWVLYIILFKAHPFQDMQKLTIFQKKLKDTRFELSVKLG